MDNMNVLWGHLLLGEGPTKGADAVSAAPPPTPKEVLRKK